MKDKVTEVLDNQIRPILQRDGGDVELIGIDEETGTVQVRLQGRCAGCPMSQMTTRAVVTRILQEQIPSIKEVVSV
ncbi:MAG: NifU family protein [Candidatus Hodarchaeota archaeon]